MGYLGYTAILQRDYPVALGILVIGSLLMLVGNILSDMIYALVDPRIRFQMTHGSADRLRSSPRAPLAANRLPSRPPSRVFGKRIRKFRRLKRGYYSFV